MTREPSERLGCGTTGAAEIKAHPFFADVNWDRIARKAHPPPFKPAVVRGALQGAIGRANVLRSRTLGTLDRVCRWRRCRRAT